MSDEFLGHFGVLSEDAPGMFSNFSNLFDTIAIDTLSRCYAWTYEHGGLNEYPCVREKGVSYNPKPARICHILWSDIRSNELEIYLLAILACSPTSSLANLGEFQVFEDSLAAITKFLDEAPYQSQCLPVEECVALALTLDKARHIHMGHLTLEAQASIHRWAQITILPRSHHPDGQSLRKKIATWCTLTQRRYQ